MEVSEIVQLWKKLKIATCTLTFDCGGDSMGNTEFVFTDKKGKEIKSTELTEYFDNAVYDRVEFYENSDGHYQGESGTVEITLDEDGEDFDYSKNAQAEYTENVTNKMEIELSPKMIEFIKENVLNINGAEGSDITVNFKRDFIMTDEQETLLEEIKNKIENEVSEFEPELEDEQEIQEWFTFTTNEEGEVLTIKGKCLKISVTNSYTEFRDSED